MYCRKCGKEISDDTKFCPECGAAVNVSASAHNPETPPIYRAAPVKVKKPFYKRWYFWVAAVFVLFWVVGTVGGRGDKTGEGETVRSTQTETPENTAAILHREEVTETPVKSKFAPLTDFWVNLYDDHTITLMAFETHDKECIIASGYIIDGKKWTVSEIGDACFFGRTSLETVSISEGVTTIAHNAFNSCTVKELYLPSTIRNINTMFEYLNQDLTVYYAGSQEQWNAIQNIGNVPENVEISYNTDALYFEDETDYDSSSLITEKSQAEQLGSALGNAANGLVEGFLEGINGD